MPRLLGVDIPDRKRVAFALRYIHGVGPTRGDVIVAQCRIDPSKKAGDLSPDPESPLQPPREITKPAVRIHRTF